MARGPLLGQQYCPNSTVAVLIAKGPLLGQQYCPNSTVAVLITLEATLSKISLKQRKGGDSRPKKNFEKVAGLISCWEPPRPGALAWMAT
jgi:hypothetical protein